MKILLTTLNSKYIHSNLALKYLYESVYAMDEDVRLIEFTINNEENYIFSEIMRGKYDLICFSCYIWNISETLSLADNLKKADPNCSIVLGGPEVSFDTEELMKNDGFIDYVIRSEGERTFYELVEALNSQTIEISKIKGLAFRSDDQIVVTETRALLDMNDIPFPYTHLAPEKDRIIYYETSRGCPFNCSYCISSTTQGVRYLPLQRVKAELEFFLDNKVPQVKFVDRTFNSHKRRSIEIMKFIQEHDNHITNFHFEMAGDLIDEEMLTLLSSVRKDLFQFEIGVQSTNEHVLSACQRRSDFHQFKKRVRQIMSYENTHLHLDLIAGLPYESFDSFKHSFNDVYDLKPHNLQLGFLKMLKGSQIRKESKKFGYVFREKEPYEIIRNDFMSADDLIRLKMIEMILDLYYNKSGFRTTLKYLIEKNNQLPFDFYDEFSQYWTENGLHHKSWKKDDLYNHLQSFAEYKDVKDKDILSEILIYDKYLASNRVINRDRNDGRLKDMVHKLLQNKEFIEKNIPTAKGMKAKEIIKKVNYGLFHYHVDGYAKGNVTEIKESLNLCIFNFENINLYEQAEVIFIQIEEELRK